MYPKETLRANLDAVSVPGDTVVRRRLPLDAEHTLKADGYFNARVGDDNTVQEWLRLQLARAAAGGAGGARGAAGQASGFVHGWVPMSELNGWRDRRCQRPGERFHCSRRGNRTGGRVPAALRGHQGR